MNTTTIKHDRTLTLLERRHQVDKELKELYRLGKSTSVNSIEEYEGALYRMFGRFGMPPHVSEAYHKATNSEHFVNLIRDFEQIYYFNQEDSNDTATF